MKTFATFEENIELIYRNDSLECTRKLSEKEMRGRLAMFQTATAAAPFYPCRFQSNALASALALITFVAVIATSIPAFAQADAEAGAQPGDSFA